MPVLRRLSHVLPLGALAVAGCTAGDPYDLTYACQDRGTPTPRAMLQIASEGRVLRYGPVQRQLQVDAEALRIVSKNVGDPDTFVADTPYRMGSSSCWVAVTFRPKNANHHSERVDWDPTAPGGPPSHARSLIAELDALSARVVAEGAITGPPPVPTTVACSSLTRRRCLWSTHCVLEASYAQSGPDYVCRPAAGRCEVGHRQTDEKACAAMPSCIYDREDCYCGCKDYGRTAVPDEEDTQDCSCYCSHGPPGQCRLRRGAAAD